MDSSGSMLKSIVERIRYYGNEPSLDATLTDALLLDHFLGPAMQDVFQRVNMVDNGFLVQRHVLPVENDRVKYPLPVNVRKVLQIVLLNEDGVVVGEAIPRHLRNPWGFNYRVNGNDLWLDQSINDLPAGYTVEIWYTPGGNFRPHYCDTTAPATIAGTTTMTLQLPTTPTLGRLDLRPNGLDGLPLRVLRKADDTKIVEEMRTVRSSSITSAGVVTLTLEGALDHYVAAETVSYEVGLPSNETLATCLALMACLHHAPVRKASNSHYQRIDDLMKRSLKTLRDDAQVIESRKGTRMARDTRGPYSYFLYSR